MREKANDDGSVDRRSFLKGAATGAAALVVNARAEAQQTRSGAATVPPPSARQLARDAGNARPPAAGGRPVEKPGSDLMVDALRSLGIEYIAANPGSSFEGLQESLVNYGDPPNVSPEFITALHEESSVDMANGYAKAEGKPMAVLLHGTLGIQHASMAIYQAFYSGTPLVMIVGRDDGFIQAHTANDMAAMVRSFTKWDAQPTSLDRCIGSIQAAYRQAMTPPTGPTLVVIDMEYQKEEAAGRALPAYREPVIPMLDEAAAAEIVTALLGAENPRLAVGRLRTPEGVRLAVELAELVGASASTFARVGPMSFPQSHPLCGPGASTDYDFTLGLEAGPADVGLVGPGVDTLYSVRDRAGVGFGAMRDREPAVMAPLPNDAGLLPRFAAASGVTTRLELDAEASLPLLVSIARERRTRAQRRAIEERSARHAAANAAAHLDAVTRALDDKRIGWSSSPVSTARIYAELWPLIENEDWCLSSPSDFSGAHHRDFWMHGRPYSYLGGQGAAGIGYGIGASVGAALAAKTRGRFVINVQCDGDLNYAPGSLWTAAHHRLPLLTIMHNNRAWHQELMFLEFMAGVRGRGTDRAHIGTTLRDPYINYAKMAETYGMASEGPIDDPNLLRAALERGIASVKRGEPYLIDVLTQPR
jgi:thiamine pyrophosphate-dependent acetolactate synthase large subunit-like protein